MKMFIFEYVSELTDRYHSDGGLVVIAKDREHVDEIIKQDEYIKLTEKEWDNVHTFDLTSAYEETYYVFPNAGCC